MQTEHFSHVAFADVVTQQLLTNTLEEHLAQ